MIPLRVLVVSAFSLLALIPLAPTASAATGCDLSDFAVVPCAEETVERLTETCDSLDCGVGGIVRDAMRLAVEGLEDAVQTALEVAWVVFETACERTGCDP